MTDKTKLCKHCQTPMPKKALVCATCHRHQQSLVWRVVKFFLIGWFVIALMVTCITMTEKPVVICSNTPNHVECLKD